MVDETMVAPALGSPETTSILAVGARVERAPKLLAEGHLVRDGSYPTCPSGGLLGVGNPIAAAGLMKVAELYWQLSGRAGRRQVLNLYVGVAQAWGDLVAQVVVCRV